jgi:hypothetical protein
MSSIIRLRNGVIVCSLLSSMTGPPRLDADDSFTRHREAMPPLPTAQPFGSTGIYYIDSTALPVCNNRRIRRHKTN